MTLSLVKLLHTMTVQQLKLTDEPAKGISTITIKYNNGYIKPGDNC